MSDALNIVARNGFDVSKMTPTSEGYNYVWDKESNKFILLNDSWTAVTPTDINDTNLNDTFGIAKNNEELTKLVEKGYGVYLSDSYNDVLPTMVNSIDTGSKGLDVTFETTKADNFIIRTNGGNLTINAANASVDHFGGANKTIINEIKNESYHEYGQSNFIDIFKGRVVAEANSTVGGIFINNSDVKVEISTSAKVNDLAAKEGVTIEVSGKPVKNENKDTFVSSNVLFAGGMGTKESPYLINSASHWNNIYQSSFDLNKERITPFYSLVENIDFENVVLNNDVFENDKKDEKATLKFILNGNDKKINNVNSFSHDNQIIPYFEGAIENLTVHFNVNSESSVGFSYATFGTTTFKNVTVEGTINTKANWASAFVLYAQGEVNYINCINKANIKGSYGNNAYVAPFGSHNGHINSKINFENCENYGSIRGGHVGFVGMGNEKKYTVANENSIKNFGTMNGSLQAGYFYYSSNAETVKIGQYNCQVKQGNASLILAGNHKDEAPTNYGDSIEINVVENAVRYEVEMSFVVHCFNYSKDNKWSGAFPRSIVRSYDSSNVVNGKIKTEFVKARIGEIKADQYYGYNGAKPTYENGIFLPNNFDLNSKDVDVLFSTKNIYLVEYKNNTFYVFFDEQSHGWYVLVNTNNTTGITINFSVQAYDKADQLL